MSVALFKNGRALDAEITGVESGLSGRVLFLLFFIYFYFMKLDTYHIKKVLGYISEGLPKEKACTIAGISKSAFYLWYNQGKEDAEKGIESLQRELYEGVPAAEIECELWHLRVIKAAAKKHWQASGWYLERRRGYGQHSEAPGDEESDEMIVIG